MSVTAIYQQPTHKSAGSEIDTGSNTAGQAGLRECRRAYTLHELEDNPIGS